MAEAHIRVFMYALRWCCYPGA